jgi:hypothetical protein
MRKSSLFGILLAVLAALAVTLPSACEKYVLPELSFEPDTLFFTAAGGTQTLSLNSKVEWEAEINRSEDTWVEWITFTPTFSDGDCDVQGTLADNTAGPLRSLSFDIKSETLKHTLTIIQEGGSAD